MIFIYPKLSHTNKLDYPKISIFRQNMFHLLHSDNDDSMKVFNHVQFQPNSCEYEWKSTYTFSTSTMRWNTTDFAQNKNNYFGCQLNIFAKIHEIDRTKILNGLK